MAKKKRMKKSTFISILFFIVIGLLILINLKQSDGVRASAQENIWEGMRCSTKEWKPYCCTRGEKGERGYKRVGAGNDCQKNHLESLEPSFSCTKGVCKKIITCKAQKDALRECMKEQSPSKPLDQRNTGFLKDFMDFITGGSDDSDDDYSGSAEEDTGYDYADENE